MVLMDALKSAIQGAWGIPAVANGGQSARNERVVIIRGHYLPFRPVGES